MRRILVLAALVGDRARGGWTLFKPARIRAPIAWQGYAEADFVKVGPTQQGLLTAVHVARGDRVVKGQPLFEQDDADDRAAVDQARRLLQQARDQLANLLSPAKPTEIDAGARPTCTTPRPRATGRRTICGGIRRCSRRARRRQQTVDQEEADLRSAEAKVAAATAALATAQAPMGRPAEIEGQKSLVDSLEAALKQARMAARPAFGRFAGRRHLSPT